MVDGTARPGGARSPTSFHGRSLRELDLDSRHGIPVLRLRSRTPARRDGARSHGRRPRGGGRSTRGRGNQRSVRAGRSDRVSLRLTRDGALGGAAGARGRDVRPERPRRMGVAASRRCGVGRLRNVLAERPAPAFACSSFACDSACGALLGRVARAPDRSRLRRRSRRADALRAPRPADRRARASLHCRRRPGGRRVAAVPRTASPGSCGRRDRS